MALMTSHGTVSFEKQSQTLDRVGLLFIEVMNAVVVASTRVFSRYVMCGIAHHYT